jgi:predicted MFS family arabinose efflux permease
MFSFLRDYRNLDRAILFAITAEFFIQLVNATFLNLQPLYMKAEGFADNDIADYISWRFAGVLFLAFPLGVFIRGRKLKNLFYLSAIGIPVFALLIIWAIHSRNHALLVIAQFLWGTSFIFIQIPILPFILRNCKPEDQTAAISLSFSTWSFAGILTAALVWVFNSADPIQFNERNMMIGITILSFLGVYSVWKISIQENTGDAVVSTRLPNANDWKLITKALIPALVIATGAGLTIPFINLFFSRVHALPTNTISLWNFVAALLVAFMALLVPKIKSSIGYKRAIPLTQSFAVISLVLLATTEYYAGLPIAVVIAVGCYLLRQPLMNLAGPMTSEIGMNYVGKKNREITSALTAAIWSGSWFMSTRFVFGVLRKTGWPYVDIFLITAGLYLLGVFLYILLIRSYVKKEARGEI